MLHMSFKSLANFEYVGALIPAGFEQYQPIAFHPISIGAKLIGQLRIIKLGYGLCARALLYALTFQKTNLLAHRVAAKRNLDRVAIQKILTDLLRKIMFFIYKEHCLIAWLPSKVNGTPLALAQHFCQIMPSLFTFF